MQMVENTIFIIMEKLWLLWYFMERGINGIITCSHLYYNIYYNLYTYVIYYINIIFWPLHIYIVYNIYNIYNISVDSPLKIRKNRNITKI